MNCTRSGVAARPRRRAAVPLTRRDAGTACRARCLSAVVDVAQTMLVTDGHVFEDQLRGVGRRAAPSCGSSCRCEAGIPRSTMNAVNPLARKGWSKYITTNRPPTVCVMKMAVAVDGPLPSAWRTARVRAAPASRPGPARSAPTRRAPRRWRDGGGTSSSARFVGGQEDVPRAEHPVVPRPSSTRPRRRPAPPPPAPPRSRGISSRRRRTPPKFIPNRPISPIGFTTSCGKRSSRPSRGRVGVCRSAGRRLHRFLQDALVVGQLEVDHGLVLASLAVLGASQGVDLHQLGLVGPGRLDGVRLSGGNVERLGPFEGEFSLPTVNSARSAWPKMISSAPACRCRGASTPGSASSLPR